MLEVVERCQEAASHEQYYRRREGLVSPPEAGPALVGQERSGDGEPADHHLLPGDEVLEVPAHRHGCHHREDRHRDALAPVPRVGGLGGRRHGGGGCQRQRGRRPEAPEGLGRTEHAHGSDDGSPLDERGSGAEGRGRGRTRSARELLQGDQFAPVVVRVGRRVAGAHCGGERRRGSRRRHASRQRGSGRNDHDRGLGRRVLRRAVWRGGRSRHVHGSDRAAQRLGGASHHGGRGGPVEAESALGAELRLRGVELCARPALLRDGDLRRERGPRRQERFRLLDDGEQALVTRPVVGVLAEGGDAGEHRPHLLENHRVLRAERAGDGGGALGAEVALEEQLPEAGAEHLLDVLPAFVEVVALDLVGAQRVPGAAARNGLDCLCLCHGGSLFLSLGG